MDMYIITKLSKYLLTFAINSNLKEKWSFSFLVFFLSSEETKEGVYKFTILTGKRNQGNCDTPKIVLHENDNHVLFCKYNFGYKVCLHLFGIIPSVVDQSTLYPTKRQWPEAERTTMTSTDHLSAQE